MLDPSDGSTFDRAQQGGPPPGCDPAADAKDAPACAVDEYAIFVDAASGVDNAAGTKAAPVKTIGAALGKLAGRPRIYLCEGTYAEAVKLSSAVSIFGGFACGTWQYTGTKSKLTPSAKGYALQVSGANGATFSDLDIAVLDATEPGESSIAVFVANSNVTFVRANVTASKAQSGTTPSRKEPLPVIASMKGGAAINPNGGVGAMNKCGDASSVGGKGANTNVGGATGGQPDLGEGKGGTTFADCAAGGGGGSGKTGKEGSPAPANTRLGELSSTGWQPASGAKGSPGTLGQGGGGGGSSTEAAGGGGGAGGCGGEGGDGGTGGGASVAILSFQSTLTLRESNLSASDGGNGGGGALGQLGQGFGGGGDQGSGATQSGCAGGRGGAGGDGGGGGGGSGGVSAAILFLGPPPQIDPSSVLTPGKAGTAGPGSAGNAGANGKSDKIIEIK